METNTIQEEQKTRKQQQLKQEQQAAPDPMARFTYALKDKESKRQYPRRFKTFLDFLNLKKNVLML